VGTDSSNLHTTAIVPVKGLSAANARLNGTLSEGERTRLAEALFIDLLVKLPRSRCIDDVLVVTADASVARQTRWFGHKVLLQTSDEGHAEAAAAGARAAIADGADRVAMLPVDCPTLEVDELDAHLGRSPRTALIVPDRHGTGTNALLLSPADAFEPAFGPDSCARHASRARAAGIPFAIERIESLALDLDTPEDLLELRDALVVNSERAPRTAELIWKLVPERDESAPTTA
jgi:2-phospho-L-lactate guanylyltransferase